MAKQSELILSIRLEPDLVGPAYALAERLGRDLSDHLLLLFVDELEKAGLLPPNLRDWIVLRENLVHRFGLKALEIIRTEGWREKIIAETAHRLVTADTDWRDGYARLIKADPFDKGVEVKSRINPMLGRRVKLLLRAKTGPQFAVPQPSILVSSSRLIEQKETAA